MGNQQFTLRPFVSGLGLNLLFRLTYRRRNVAARVVLWVISARLQWHAGPLFLMGSCHEGRKTSTRSTHYAHDPQSSGAFVTFYKSTACSVAFEYLAEDATDAPEPPADHRVLFALSHGRPAPCWWDCVNGGV